MKYSKKYRKLNIPSCLPHLWCAVHFSQLLFQHFFEQGKTIQMYCPGMDTRLPDLWPKWRSDRAMVTGERMDKIDLSSPYADSNRNSDRRRRYHHQTQPSIALTHAKYAPTFEPFSTRAWIFCFFFRIKKRKQINIHLIAFVFKSYKLLYFQVFFCYAFYFSKYDKITHVFSNNPLA